ncbi:hypothetical protein QKW60_12500 [Defluviimonas aestuarii]|uniref:hypothetical protein n=1 Tax=Albidovulum aestuarii TaxID=1130726 RepID=UPI00249B45D4|nr:hypothetical protein [Defluviimonas aestuarii]MDI3337231.1 hypothetical protein [Defluviimonas aestuarii]
MKGILPFGGADKSADSTDPPLVGKAWFAWSLIVLALLVLIYRSMKYGGYFPDDAYITYRFAEHLSRGLGIVWNEGGPPTEGSTSFLQTLLVATGFRFGLPVATIAYMISTVSVVVLLVTLWRTALRLTGRFALGMALPLVLFLSGVHFSLHVNAGMDTIVAIALLAVSFLTALNLLARPGWSRALLLVLIGFLCLWCRPDTAPYLIGQGVVLVLSAFGDWRSGRNPHFLRQILIAYALLVIAGAAYLVWKYSYYGYILPNSFYIKGTDLSDLAGLVPVVRFLKETAIQGSVLAVLLVFVDWRVLRPDAETRSVARVGLLVLPVACFLLYNLTTTHLVNYSSRFEYPVAAFFWIGSGWLLTRGRAFERLAAVLQRLGGLRAAYGGLAALVLVAIAVPLQIGRQHHTKWFSYVQVMHYEPLSAALIRTGAGPDITLVYDAAGFIPFDSKVSFIDPVGLCDNTLSGRTPMTPLEREKYIWGSNPDVYLGPYPPASPGAVTAADDPLMDTVYARKILLNPETFEDYGPYMREMTDAEQQASVHYRMRELRNNWIAIGEFPYPFGVDAEYTHFIYVRAGSAYADKLVEELGKVTTRKLEEIDFNDVLKGQRPLSRQEAERLSAMR